MPNFQFPIFKIIEKIQRYFVCSLQRKTLILLWIVMIGCGFHMWCFNFNQNQPISCDNNEPIISSKTDAVQKTKVANNVITKEKRTIVTETNHRRTKRYPIIDEITEDVKNVIAETISSDIAKLVEHFNNKIIPKVLDRVKNSGIMEHISEHVAKDIVDNINFRVNEHLNELEIRVEAFFKNFIRFYFRIWSMLGFGGSAVGIYAIHRKAPECLTFSVFFFYFSAVSQFLMMSEINVDFNVERKIFLMSELIRIDWSGCIQSSIILVNFGFLFFIAVLVYFAIVVKKCQIAMHMKEDVLKKIDPNYKICESQAMGMNYF